MLTHEQAQNQAIEFIAKHDASAQVYKIQHLTDLLLWIANPIDGKQEEMERGREQYEESN